MLRLGHLVISHFPCSFSRFAYVHASLCQHSIVNQPTKPSLLSSILHGHLQSQLFLWIATSNTAKMSNRVYYDIDKDNDVKKPFLGTITAIGNPPKRSLSWKVTLLLHWIAISILCLVAFNLYAQLRGMNAEIAEQVYCRTSGSRNISSL